MSKIDFYKKRRIFLIITLSVLAVGIVLNVLFGTKLDIAFKGGTIISYSYEGDIPANDIAAVAEDVLGVSVSTAEKQDYVTQMKSVEITYSTKESLSTEKQNELTSALEEKYPDNQVVLLKTNSVDPQMGKEFLQKCMVAIVLAVVFMLIYVAIRFRKIGGLSAGVCALIGLATCIAIVYFIFVALKFPINDNFIAVVLTIIGYALNDTVVVFDRVRENRKLMGPKVGAVEIVNKSINNCLTRTIYTSVTTTVSVLIVCIVALIGNISSIISFAVPLLVGVAIDVYATNCISLPLWAKYQDMKEKKAALQPAK